MMAHLKLVKFRQCPNDRPAKSIIFCNDICLPLILAHCLKFLASLETFPVYLLPFLEIFLPRLLIFYRVVISSVYILKIQSPNRR